MKYKVIFSPQFEYDLDRAFNYISRSLFSPKAADTLMSEIDKSIMLASENPYMYPLCPEPLSLMGLRKIIVKNYIAVYNINEPDKTVNFLNLFYGGQNYTRFFS
ncbi:MAG: type II toxin-antitoxin system RelE/ParE family toxin [Ruminococcus sp.]|nr:type II toxin-antitoxin system RelE/ParE family toxin [Ruminococcus sp.]